MSIRDIISGPRPDAVLYLRQEGPMSAAEFGTAVAPILERFFRTLGQEVRAIPVTWSVKSVPQEDGGDSGLLVYQWEVFSPRELRGLISVLTQTLQVDQSGDLSSAIARYQSRPPDPTITSFKVLLQKKDPGADIAAVIGQARDYWRQHIHLPGSYMRLVAYGDAIPGDRGEVPTPTVRGRVPAWGIAAGALALAGAVGVAIQQGRKKR